MLKTFRSALESWFTSLGYHEPVSLAAAVVKKLEKRTDMERLKVAYDVAFGETPCTTLVKKLNITRRLLKKSLVNFFPLDVSQGKWDVMEIHPVLMVTKADGESFCEVCEPDIADFYSVYVHWTTGGVTCVGDFTTKELAEAFVRCVESIVLCEEVRKNFLLKK